MNYEKDPKAPLHHIDGPSVFAGRLYVGTAAAIRLPSGKSVVVVAEDHESCQGVFNALHPGTPKELQRWKNQRVGLCNLSQTFHFGNPDEPIEPREDWRLSRWWDTEGWATCLPERPWEREEDEIVDGEQAQPKED
jgi:hypothetical protein